MSGIEKVTAQQKLTAHRKLVDDTQRWLDQLRAEEVELMEAAQRETQELYEQAARAMNMQLNIVSMRETVEATPQVSGILADLAKIAAIRRGQLPPAPSTTTKWVGSGEWLYQQFPGIVANPRM